MKIRQLLTESISKEDRETLDEFSDFYEQTINDAHIFLVMANKVLPDKLVNKFYKRIKTIRDRNLAIPHKAENLDAIDKELDNLEYHVDKLKMAVSNFYISQSSTQSGVFMRAYKAATEDSSEFSKKIVNEIL